MTYSLNFSLLILVLASITLQLTTEQEVTTTTTPSLMQVGQAIPGVIGNAANAMADTATDTASMLLPEIINSAMPVPGEPACNTTAFMHHLDTCMTPERVTKWIKIAKPFIRLMAKTDSLPNKKSNKG